MAGALSQSDPPLSGPMRSFLFIASLLATTHAQSFGMRAETLLADYYINEGVTWLSQMHNSVHNARTASKCATLCNGGACTFFVWCANTHTCILKSEYSGKVSAGCDTYARQQYGPLPFQLPFPLQLNVSTNAALLPDGHIKLSSNSFVNAIGGLDVGAITGALLATNATCNLRELTATVTVLIDKFTFSHATMVGFNDQVAGTQAAAALAAGCSLPTTAVSLTPPWPEFTPTGFAMPYALKLGRNTLLASEALIALASAQTANKLGAALYGLLCGASDCADAWVHLDGPPAVSATVACVPLQK